jgi:hypothetical protein
MHRRNNRFGWLPIIVVVIALIAIFGGRGRNEFGGRNGPWNERLRVERLESAERFRAEQLERAERFRAERDQWQYRGDGRYEFSQRWHGPMVFAPFFFFGKLLKLLLALGLIAGGLYLLRRDRRPRWREPKGPNDGPGTPLGPIFHA